MREERAKLSRGSDVAKAMDYMLKRWRGFARFLDDGRVCLSNNAAERALRGIALGSKSRLFAGSDHGGQRAAATNGGGTGRGSPGKRPLVIAVETDPNGRPRRMKLARIPRFKHRRVKSLTKRVIEPGSRPRTPNVSTNAN